MQRLSEMLELVRTGVVLCLSRSETEFGNHFRYVLKAQRRSTMPPHLSL